ncbi:PTS transporter subunit EIIC [Klebsiella pneumoniae]|nr:PTS transporter subunit EIIC [Klebsiella pneumoniae]
MATRSWEPGGQLLADREGYSLPTTDAAILKANNTQNIIGIPSIDTGILGAVIAGDYQSGCCTNASITFLRPAGRPGLLSARTRFVPTVTTVVLGLVGLAIPLVWPVFAMGINALGKMINSAGDFGPMIFGTGERLLLPFGLHHILVALIPLYRSRRHPRRSRSQRQRRADHLPGAQLSCPTTHGFRRRKRHPFPVAG